MIKLLGHNLGVVYRFEVIRMLKKKSFWFSIFVFPASIVFIALLSLWSNNSSNEILKDASKDIKFSYIDKGTNIKPEAAKALKAQISNDFNESFNEVKSGRLDMLVVYPADLNKSQVKLYAKNAGLFDNSKYQNLANALLENSIAIQVNPGIVSALKGKVNFATEYYQDGEKHDLLAEMLIPGAFLVVFYFIMCVFGSQMLNATVEEKENRVTEMLFTTITSRTLIVGKIFSFLTLVLIQIALITLLALGVYLCFYKQLGLPSIAGISVSFDIARTVVASLIFIVSILLFSGILVAIGAVAPTAKEANQYVAIPVMLTFAPLYMAPLLMTKTTTPVISFLMYCPITAPIPLMIRNAVGNLSIFEALISLLIMSVATVLVFILAAKLFQTGSVEYNRRLSLKSIWHKHHN